MRQDLEDLLEEWSELSVLDDADWSDDAEGYDEAGLGEVLREALHDRYADADAEEMSDALDAVLDGMSAAEAFSIGKALRQIERGRARHWRTRWSARSRRPPCRPARALSGR